MRWLWIFGVLLCLLALLLMTRAGVQAAFGETLTLDVRIGPFHIGVLPMKERPKKEKKPKKRKKPENTAEKKPKTSLFPKPSPQDVLDAAKTLWPPLRRTLGRTVRGIRVDPLELYLTVGGQEDPAGAARLYGQIQGVVWSVMPQLERLLDLPDPHVALDMDFAASENRFSGQAGVTIRIGTAIRIGLGMAFPALRWFLRYRKRKTAKSRAEKT